MYTELCRIDLINNNLESEYPYTLQDDLVFTQHELVLQYKQNYCKNISILENPKGGAKCELVASGGIDTGAPTYVYMLFDA